MQHSTCNVQHHVVARQAGSLADGDRCAVAPCAVAPTVCGSARRRQTIALSSRLFRLLFGLSVRAFAISTNCWMQTSARRRQTRSTATTSSSSSSRSTCTANRSPYAPRRIDRPRLGGAHLLGAQWLEYHSLCSATVCADDSANCAEWMGWMGEGHWGTCVYSTEWQHKQTG